MAKGTKGTTVRFKKEAGGSDRPTGMNMSLAIQTKLAEAKAAVEAADAKVAAAGAAGDEVAKTAALAERTAAEGDVARYQADLDGAAAAADEPRQFFAALSPINHDGQAYAIGDDVELTRGQYDQLKPAGAIEGEWKD
jgi:ATP/maltotriose-dependent transcriptional regulator MalT